MMATPYLNVKKKLTLTKKTCSAVLCNPAHLSCAKIRALGTVTVAICCFCRVGRGGENIFRDKYWKTDGKVENAGSAKDFTAQFSRRRVLVLFAGTIY